VPEAVGELQLLHARRPRWDASKARHSGQGPQDDGESFRALGVSLGAMLQEHGIGHEQGR